MNHNRAVANVESTSAKLKTFFCCRLRHHHERPKFSSTKQTFIVGTSLFRHSNATGLNIRAWQETKTGKNHSLTKKKKKTKTKTKKTYYEIILESFGIKLFQNAINYNQMKFLILEFLYINKWVQKLLSAGLLPKTMRSKASRFHAFAVCNFVYPRCYFSLSH